MALENTEPIRGVWIARAILGVEGTQGQIDDFVRRIWAHEISIFLPRPRDIAHQSLLLFSAGCKRSMMNRFNSSQVGPESVPYNR